MFKATLDTGKVVILRPLDIRTQRMCIEAASRSANGNTAMLSYYTQEELVKALVVEVDGKKLSAREKENLDALYTPAEYAQILLAVDEISGSAKKPKIEAVSTGGEQ